MVSRSGNAFFHLATGLVEMSSGMDSSGIWESGAYRLSQCLGLLMGIPDRKLSIIVNGGFWEICEFYGRLLAQLGGHWRMELHAEQHYGLKALDTNISPELTNKAALTIEATALWADWRQRMGKAKDEKVHAKDAFT